MIAWDTERQGNGFRGLAFGFSFAVVCWALMGVCAWALYEMWSAWSIVK